MTKLELELNIHEMTDATPLDPYTIICLRPFISQLPIT